MGLMQTLKKALTTPLAWPSFTRNDSNFSATYGSGNPSGFAGAAITRLTSSLANWSGSINIDLEGNVGVLRARARQLAANNEHGKRFLSQCATNIVGRAGPKLQVRAYKAQPNTNSTSAPQLDKAANDAVEIHWARWGKSADIGRRMDFPQMLRVIAKGVARDGEQLVRVIVRNDLPYGMALQLIDIDRLDETLNVTLKDGAIRMGVEIDSAGAPVALYIKTKHPGDRYGVTKMDVERVPMSEVFHVFLQERAEQVRGYTWFHAIILRALQLHGFNDAAVLAARIGASKIAALERSEDSLDQTDSLGDGRVGGALQMNVEGGEMFELPPGYKLNSWNPDYPHANYESFCQEAVRGISAGLDVAAHNLSGNMTQVNYSSARIAELAEREVWIVLQDWLINTLIEPIYMKWLGLALLRGDITFEQSGKSLPADKYAKFANASRFQGRRWRWVDPSKEMSAFAEGVALGVTSRTRIAAEQGDDIDDVLDELAQENAAMKAAGLLVEPPPMQTPAPPLPQNEQDQNKQMRAFIQALADRQTGDTVIHNHPPAVNITTPDVRVENHPQQISIATPEVRIENNIPETHIVNEIHEREQPAPLVEVTVEAIMPEKSEVTIVGLPQRKTVSKVEHNMTGDIISSMQVESDI